MVENEAHAAVAAAVANYPQSSQLLEACKNDSF